MVAFVVCCVISSRKCWYLPSSYSLFIKDFRETGLFNGSYLSPRLWTGFIIALFQSSSPSLSFMELSRCHVLVLLAALHLQLCQTHLSSSNWRWATGRACRALQDEDVSRYRAHPTSFSLGGEYNDICTAFGYNKFVKLVEYYKGDSDLENNQLLHEGLVVNRKESND